MSPKTTSPYGSWKSPITAELITQDTVTLESVAFYGEDIYWIEELPAEAGRNTVMKKSKDGNVTELTPAPFNVRSRVHEYGGAPFLAHQSQLFFSNFEDNLLYLRQENGSIHPITSDSNHRYADASIDASHGRLYWVREDHTESAIFAETTIVAMDLDGNNEIVIVSGNEFYSNPRISPDAKQLAYLTWNHPNMPWDETELWTADLNDDGSVSNAKRVAGGTNESIIQPVWSPDGVLYFLSDRSNWWNIMRLNNGEVEEVCPMEAEFGSPSWIFGKSDYDFIDETTIIASYVQNGRQHLAKIDVQNGTVSPVETGFSLFYSIHSNGQKITFIAASPTQFPRVVRVDLDGKQVEEIRLSSSLTLDENYLSLPEPIEFPTEGGKTAHAIYYRPKNADYMAPADEKPPLLVHVHGGPTSASPAILDLAFTQYWTSRGFAVVDVNYGGSTGYGREYRERLRGNWGIVDVQDCANAVRYLVEQGEVDSNRVAIAGGSAGGYTTLASLAFTDVYKAGASYFGLSELEVFATETHKFESRYMDSMLGPYPEAKQVYYDRSPINFTDQLSCPVIFFQGLDDKIVPPNQAELMVEALKEKGLPVAYLAFEGEGHGFRMDQNIKRSIEGELYFYSKVFGFTPSDDIEPVPIDNL
ncbi:S9 family peptidase [Planococcus shixiaomingii]|uniref:S9 family peptidase n=1 Tax=Planococcus shixiaomingii TaxID=3058393 RepID=UPI002623F8D4|nr:S9 family peptidase [Planococcus sp. N022]WKA54746.1 S9 family peptidase [Planococcus sp. N022]